jgi:transcriptional regulator with XRE-family HTH domain
MTPTPRQLGQRLKKARMAKGLTRYALAKVAGINREYVRKLEDGESSPTVEMLGRLAKVLGVTAGKLIEQGTPHASASGVTRRRLAQPRKETTNVSHRIPDTSPPRRAGEPSARIDAPSAVRQARANLIEGIRQERARRDHARRPLPSGR